jgi:hypothetical protein
MRARSSASMGAARVVGALGPQQDVVMSTIRYLANEE